MRALGIPVSTTATVFGQTYGMGDHISYTLGKTNTLQAVQKKNNNNKSNTF